VRVGGPAPGPRLSPGGTRNPPIAGGFCWTRLRWRAIRQIGSRPAPAVALLHGRPAGASPGPTPWGLHGVAPGESFLLTNVSTSPVCLTGAHYPGKQKLPHGEIFREVSKKDYESASPGRGRCPA